MPRFLLTPQARADLLEIAEHLTGDGPIAAERVLAKLRASMGSLADMPQMGHLRPDLTSADVRFWTVYSYFIVYRPDTSPLQVVRVLHGARDLPGLLGQ